MIYTTRINLFPGGEMIFKKDESFSREGNTQRNKSFLFTGRTMYKKSESFLQGEQCAKRMNLFYRENGVQKE